MKAKDQKIIFLNSYLPRTGHNFASEVFKIFSDHEVLAHPRSETRLSTILDSYYKIYEQKIFYDSDKEFVDELFINDLREKIINQSAREFIMIKDTSFVGADKLSQVFPDDLHFLLIRDPKAVFLSLFKAMALSKRSWKNRAKKIGIPVGFYPYAYSKKLSVQVLKTLPNLSGHSVIRYEDLVNKDDKVLLKLKEKFHTAKSLEQIKKEIDEILVINSSFFEENKAKGIWDQKGKTANFNPLNRKSQGYLLRKGVELGSKKLRQKLNYI